MKQRRHPITIYCLETGLICGNADAVEGAEDRRCEPGKGWIKGNWSAKTHRVNPATGRANKLPRLPIRVAPNRITGIPPGTVVIERPVAKHLVDDGVFEVEVDWPETVSLVLQHRDYLDCFVELECVP